MKLKLDCLACIMRQVVEAGRLSTEEDTLIKEIIDDYARMIPEINFTALAPEITVKIQDIIKEKTGKNDPYAPFKQKNIKRAEKVYPVVKKAVEKSKDPLLGALIMAATGNIIDAGIGLEVDLENKIDYAEEKGFKHSDYHSFVEKLEKGEGKKILIIGDNAGEGVFDRLLIEELNKYKAHVTYAVRGVPILNDITLKEAREIGLHKICQLISSGCDTPGLIQERADSSFLKIFEEADIVISKGQGNLEGLSEISRQIFFLLIAKCKVVASELGVEEGDLVFKMM